MAQFVVLQNWTGVVGGGVVRIPAGEILDDVAFDVEGARAGGLAVIAYTVALEPTRQRYVQERARGRDADFTALLHDAGFLGGQAASGNVTGPAGATPSSVALFDGASGTVLREGPTIGTSANELVQLDSSAQLPAVDGSQLTGILTQAASGVTANHLVIADGGGNLQEASAREEADRFVFTKSIEAPPGSVFLGENVRLSAIGEKLGAQDMAEDIQTIAIAQAFTDAGSTKPEYLQLAAVALLSTQTDNTATQTGTSVDFAVNDATAPAEGITSDARLDFQSAPSAITIQLWLGTDDTGPRLVNATVPVVNGVNIINLPSPITLRGSTDYFVRLSATTSFTIRGSTGTFVPWYELRGQEVTRRALAAVDELGNATQLQGRDVAATAPTDGQALIWDNAGTQWAPATIGAGGAPSGSAGGDLGGTYPNPSVTRVQGRTVLNSAPTNNQALLWNGTSTQWEPGDVVVSVGGFTGVVTQQQIQGLVASDPALTNFHTTAPSQVPASTDLTGQVYSAAYDLANAVNAATVRLISFPTVAGTPIEVLVADASRVEGANTQGWTFPAGVTFSEGFSYTVQVEAYTSGQVPGTDTPVSTQVQTILGQAASRTDVLYFGTSTDNTPANVDVTTLSSQTRLDGNVTLPTWADSEYLIFAYPSSAAAVTALNIGGINQLPAFTLTTSAITVEGTTPYDVLISNNLLIGSVTSGTVVTIVR